MAREQTKEQAKQDIWSSLCVPEELKKIAEPVLKDDPEVIRKFFSLISTAEYRSVFQALQSGNAKAFIDAVRAFGLLEYTKEEKPKGDKPEEKSAE